MKRLSILLAALCICVCNAISPSDVILDSDSIDEVSPELRHLRGRRLAKMTCINFGGNKGFHQVKISHHISKFTSLTSVKPGKCTGKKSRPLKNRLKHMHTFCIDGLDGKYHNVYAPEGLRKFLKKELVVMGDDVGKMDMCQSLMIPTNLISSGFIQLKLDE